MLTSIALDFSLVIVWWVTKQVTYLAINTITGFIYTPAPATLTLKAF